MYEYISMYLYAHITMCLLGTVYVSVHIEMSVVAYKCVRYMF